MRADYAMGRAIIAHHSKSFALASRLLAPRARDRVAAAYAWCRACDDAIDLNPPHTHDGVLDALQRELRSIYAGDAQSNPSAALFQTVVRDCAIPIDYPNELLEGLRMDASGRRYAETDDLLRYAFRVAGTVGLMMCHVLGVSDARALANAAHLGIAMQLTNIARDVAEDWQRGRLYLPGDLLGGDRFAALERRLGEPLTADDAAAMAPAVAELLRIADGYYASGDRGLPFLDWRASLSVRTARLVYADIGAEIRSRRHDILAGRAVVPGRRKARLALLALGREIAAAPARWRRGKAAVAPSEQLALHEALHLGTSSGGAM